jgi:hypothetical protein
MRDKRLPITQKDPRGTGSLWDPGRVPRARPGLPASAPRLVIA